MTINTQATTGMEKHESGKFYLTWNPTLPVELRAIAFDDQTPRQLEIIKDNDARYSALLNALSPHQQSLLNTADYVLLATCGESSQAVAVYRGTITNNIQQNTDADKSSAGKFNAPVMSGEKLTLDTLLHRIQQLHRYIDQPDAGVFLRMIEEHHRNGRLSGFESMVGPITHLSSLLSNFAEQVRKATDDSTCPLQLKVLDSDPVHTILNGEFKGKRCVRIFARDSRFPAVKEKLNITNVQVGKVVCLLVESGELVVLSRSQIGK